MEQILLKRAWKTLNNLELIISISVFKRASQVAQW